jgi:histone H3/H4
LHEIRHVQKSVALLIPRLPFSRLLREIASNFRSNLRMQSIALAALQEASEILLTMWFQMLYIFFLKASYSSQLAAFHGRRVTVMSKDAHLVAKIINIWDCRSFFRHFVSGVGPVYEQQLPFRKQKRSRTHRRDLDAPRPHYKGKSQSSRPNAASNMTGGRAPQFNIKLAQKAAMV